MIDIEIPEPHPAQFEVLENAKRFNVLCIGRRGGKSTIIPNLCTPAFDGLYYIGVFSPTYKDLSEVWRDLKNRFQPIIKRKDEQLKQIELITGGIIDFWSMDDPDSGRGRKYHRVIIDECEKARHFQYAWEKTIRATLADFKGDAWFLSTPKGQNTYFHELFENENKYDDWKSWQMPTSINPYIPPEEIESAEAQLDPLTFRQEFLAEFISHADRPFMYCFEDRHLSDSAVYKTGHLIYLSFDFNANPMTCVISQSGKDWLHFIDEIFIPNSDIGEVCKQIKSKFPDVPPSRFMVTGDHSGKSRTGLMKNINYYTIIERELRLQSAQIVVPVNPSHQESNALSNALLSNHKELLFHPVKCKNTIYDMRYTEWDGSNIIKQNRGKREQQADLLDTVRYTFNTWHYKFLNGAWNR